MSREHFDIVVLGSGGTGEWVSKHTAEAGKRVALVEAGRVGGFCHYVACVPSKGFLRAGEARHQATRLTALGAASVDPHLDESDRAFRAMVVRRDELAGHRDDTATAKDVESAGVHLVRGFGKVVAPGVVAVGDRLLGYTDLVIATGSEPVVPPVPGLAEAKTWTSEQALSTQDRPASLVVLGGGPVGCELAQAFARFGVQVTLVESGEQLLGKEEPSVAALLKQVLEDDGVDVRLGSPLEHVGAGNVCTLADGSTVAAERIVVCVGRRPVTSGIGLDVLGIEPDEHGGLALEPTGQVVGQEHVWAGGDATGCAPYTHTANYHGRVIAGNLTGRPSRLDMRAIPRAVFTEPAVASVGVWQSDRETITAGVDLDQVARATFEGLTTGRLVLTMDAEKKVLIGAAAIGAHADSWISEATLAIRAEIGIDVLVDVVHGFPTFTEAYDLPLRQLHDRAHGQ